MRSMKLLVAMALVAALVAGPVLAQDAGGTMSPSSTSSADGGKTVKHHSGKKHKGHKKSSSSTAPAATPAQ